MKFKNKQEVLEANLDDWEKEAILENMEFQEALSYAVELINKQNNQKEE